MQAYASETLGVEDEQQGMTKLQKKMWVNNNRAETISATVNWCIEKPFADYSMTLQTIKKEKHAAWLDRKQ